MNTDELRQVLRLSLQEHRDDIWARCRAKPGFWTWFLGDRCVQYLTRRAQAELGADMVRRWAEPPGVAERPGHLIVPVVPRLVADDPTQWQLAAPSFGLPIVWTRSPSKSRLGLPTSLVQLAEDVKGWLGDSGTLRERYGKLESRWRIEWSDLNDWNGVDLSELSLSPESAWAPLAVGLISAISQIAVSNELMITGCWDSRQNRWMVGLDTLQFKLKSAIRWGRTKFAVPKEALETAKKAIREIVSELNNEPDRQLPVSLSPDEIDEQVTALTDRTEDPFIAIRPALWFAGMEPGESEGERANYYLERPTSKNAREYFVDRLLNDIVTKQREHLRRDHQILTWQPESLVSIISHSPELVLLAASLFHPRECHLIYTEETDSNMRPYFDEIAAWLSRTKSRPIPHPVKDDRSGLSELHQLVSQLPRPHEHTVLIDSTPGRRPMSLALLQGAKKGDRILCWWTDTCVHTRRPRPFSEFPLLWEVMGEGILKPLLVPGDGSTTTIV